MDKLTEEEFLKLENFQLKLGMAEQAAKMLQQGFQQFLEQLKTKYNLVDGDEFLQDGSIKRAPKAPQS